MRIAFGGYPTVEGGGRLLACEFRPLPARPMRVHEMADTSATDSLEREVRAAIAAARAVD